MERCERAAQAGLAQLSEEESDAYFNSRPRGSRIGAHASDQSEYIASYEALEEKVRNIEKDFEGKDVPRPKHWGGYLIQPTLFEFWQGRPSRLHQRIRFIKSPDGWVRKILNP